MAYKPKGEMFPIIVPNYRGYIAALKMYAPVVSPIMVTRAQLQQMLLSGLDVYLYDLATKMTARLAITDLAGGKNPMDKVKIAKPKIPTVEQGVPKVDQKILMTSMVSAKKAGEFKAKTESAPVPTPVEPKIPETMKAAVEGQMVEESNALEDLMSAVDEEPVVAESEPQVDEQPPMEEEPQPESAEPENDAEEETNETQAYFQSLFEKDHLEESEVKWDELSKKQRKKIRAKLNAQNSATQQ